jgi:hypothetical protein
VEKAAVSLNWICQRLSGGGEGGHTAIEAPSGRLGKPIKHVPQLECGLWIVHFTLTRRELEH